MYTEKLSEALAVVATVDPDAYGTGAQNSDEIDMSRFHRLIAIVMAGTLGASGTLDFKLQSANAAGGSYSDLTGKAITQLTQAGSDDDKQAIVELSAEELNRLDADGRYVKGVLTVGTAASDAAVLLLGECARHKPASQDDLASVDEIVS